MINPCRLSPTPPPRKKKKPSFPPNPAPREIQANFLFCTLPGRGARRASKSSHAAGRRKGSCGGWKPGPGRAEPPKPALQPVGLVLGRAGGKKEKEKQPREGRAEKWTSLASEGHWSALPPSCAPLNRSIKQPSNTSGKGEEKGVPEGLEILARFVSLEGSLRNWPWTCVLRLVGWLLNLTSPWPRVPLGKSRSSDGQDFPKIVCSLPFGEQKHLSSSFFFFSFFSEWGI